MTDAEVLDEIFQKLKSAVLVDEAANPDEYWMEVTVRCENATDFICDTYDFLKDLVRFIKTETGR